MFTRVRLVNSAGVVNFSDKGAPDSGRSEWQPWYKAPDRQSRGTPIVFGHWSTLRLSRDAQAEEQVYPLDTGAVWGDSLTALRLDDMQYFSVRARR